ncbi:DUF4197 domain-containing protein [Ekhidna sp.]
MKTLKNIFSISLITSIGFAISCDGLDEIIDLPLTDVEITQGLKEALSVGLNTSVNTASKSGGYLQNEIIKILLPDEVVQLQSTINSSSILKPVYDVYLATNNGGNDIFEELIAAMNNGAENAADKALPIFGNAITSMTITDARGILDGGQRSATDFFEQQTRLDLVTAFSPDVKNALDGTGAIELFGLVSGFLNQSVGFGTTVSDFVNVEVPSSIEEYATGKAVDGLFHLVGEEEKKIRDDPFAWSSAIIERVFGSNQ